MLCHLVSTDPNNYGTVKFTSSIGKINSSIMYRINSVSFLANLSITTSEDYLSIVYQNQTYIFTFEEKGRYGNGFLNDPYFLSELNQLLATQLENFNISMNDRGLLVITAPDEFQIKDASHNVKLLLGLYHSELPINSSRPKISESETHCELIMPSVPYRSYGNVLYLTARTDVICYKTNEILYPGFPVMCKIPSQWSIINSSQLNQLEFTLVDFQFQPVKLHSPLYITLELNYPSLSEALGS